MAMNEKLLTELNENLKLLLGPPKKPDKDADLNAWADRAFEEIKLKYARKLLLKK